MIVDGRLCAWCRGPIPLDARSDSRFCCKAHRQAAHRFGRQIERRDRAAIPKRLAYADPPYPGLSAKYYADHPDYDGEVDHRALLIRLRAYDGWALSTSSAALDDVKAMCRELDIEARTAAWFRGSRPGRSIYPHQAWEPVIYVRGRLEPTSNVPDDALVFPCHARTTDVDRVIGAKPATFISWMFGLIGARPGDTFDDLFPGSGGVGRAWSIYASSEYSGDGSPPGATDASPRGRPDASAAGIDDVSSPPWSDDASQAARLDTSPRGRVDASLPGRLDGLALERVDASGAENDVDPG